MTELIETFIVEPYETCTSEGTTRGLHLFHFSLKNVKFKFKKWLVYFKINLRANDTKIIIS